MKDIKIIDHEISEVQVQSSDCGMVSITEWWNGDGYSIIFVDEKNSNLQSILLFKDQISLLEIALAKIRNI